MHSVDAVPQGQPGGRLLAAVRSASPGAVVLALALPPLFLHVQYQPSVSLPLGATLKLQDLAVMAVVAAAAVAAARGELRLLRPALPLWLATGAFLAWIVAATFYPLLSSRPYAWSTHFVTLVGFCEYTLLAPAVPLVVRRRADAMLVLGTLTAWTVAATAIGVVQWLGVDIVGAWPQGRRQPSFLGQHDFTALAGMSLGAGLLGLLWLEREPRLRKLAWVATAAGGVGFVVSGTSAGVIGLVPALLAVLYVTARRRSTDAKAVAGAVAVTTLVSLGVLALRARDFDQFFRFLGVKQPQRVTHTEIQTYSQRTLLAYIGLRVWLHHPLLGVGWQGTTEQSAIAPELPAAHRRFPDVAETAFPGPGREYGVQMLYVQVLSDLGIVGFVLLVSWIGAVLVVGLRAALHAPAASAFAATLGTFWFVLALGLWAALQIVAGVPLDATTWLAVGAVAAGASGRIGA